MENGAIKAEQLFRLVVDKRFNVSFEIDGLIIAFAIAVIFLALLIKAILSMRMRRLEIDEAEFGLGNQKFKLRPNLTDMQIAYKIWVELSTRKIGLAIELDNDVISEVYDSWYGFFSVTRELIKEVPVSRFRRSDTNKIIRLSIEVLNSGIRPHLTKWQARFRRWYEHEIKKEDNLLKTPQEIQREFPNYTELTEDMIEVNRRLIQYRKKMHELVLSN